MKNSQEFCSKVSSFCICQDVCVKHPASPNRWCSLHPFHVPVHAFLLWLLFQGLSSLIAEQIKAVLEELEGLQSPGWPISASCITLISLHDLCLLHDSLLVYGCFVVERCWTRKKNLATHLEYESWRAFSELPLLNFLWSACEGHCWWKPNMICCYFKTNDSLSGEIMCSFSFPNNSNRK